MPAERLVRWMPTVLLAGGLGLLQLSNRQEVMPLRAPLGATLPDSLLGFGSRDQVIGPEEIRVAGMTNYLMRVYQSEARAEFSLYVGYYDSQVQGSSIHSPKNCLPGAGWEPLSSGTADIVTADGASWRVNRYMLEKDGQRALVYYWYQGRGRISWNEYQVKWELLRDKALHGRSEEALVRIVVPVWPGSEEASADSMAVTVAGAVMPRVALASPHW